MRHQRNYRKLGRSPKHRKALMRNLATSLFTHEYIKTTMAKAKEVQPFIEKIINRARREDQHNAHRYVNSVLFTRQSQINLFREIVPRFNEENRLSGYTRVSPAGRRANDQAEMAVIELIGNQNYTTEKNLAKEDLENDEIDTFWKFELRLLRQEQ